MKKNMQRLGGAGLSLEAFANAKSRNNAYNPTLLILVPESLRSDPRTLLSLSWRMNQVNSDCDIESIVRMQCNRQQARGSEIRMECCGLVAYGIVGY